MRSFKTIIMIIMLIVGFIATMIMYGNKVQCDMIRRILADDQVLRCNIIGRGEVFIEPSKVIGYDHSDNRWIFKNGSSKTCEIIDK